MKVKLFEHTTFTRLEEDLNRFLQSGDCKKVIDIKYNSNVIQDNQHIRYLHSALVMYE